jgi:hypothetical protein
LVINFEDESDIADTVTSDRYVTMVNEFLFPDLRHRDIQLDTVRFQQDGVTAHTAQQSMNVLGAVFEHPIISRHGDIPWPARSPDLSACDFFSRGYMKSKVFQTRPTDLNNLEQRISEEINAMSAATLLRVVESVAKSLYQCINLDERRLTGVTVKK